MPQPERNLYAELVALVGPAEALRLQKWVIEITGDYFSLCKLADNNLPHHYNRNQTVYPVLRTLAGWMTVQDMINRLDEPQCFITLEYMARERIGLIK